MRLSLCALLFLIASCSRQSTEPNPTMPEPIIQSDKIFVSLSGGNGVNNIVKLSADNLIVIDSFNTGRDVPKIALSPDKQFLYAQLAGRLCEIDTKLMTVTRSVLSESIGGGFLPINGVSAYNNYIIECAEFEDKSILRFRNRETLNVIKTDTSLLFAVSLGDTPFTLKNEKMYLTSFIIANEFPRSRFKGFTIYDMNTFQVKRSINVPLPISSFVDSFVVSPDEELIYGVIWRGNGFGSGSSSLAVIETSSGKIISEMLCKGIATQLTQSPDGRYIYLCDPAHFGIGEYPPSNEIQIFDTQTRTLQTFSKINEWNLNGGYTLLSRTICSEDGKWLYAVVHLGDLATRTGERVALLKFNTETRRLQTFLSFPRDERGNSQTILSIAQ